MLLVNRFRKNESNHKFLSLELHLSGGKPYVLAELSKEEQLFWKEEHEQDRKIKSGNRKESQKNGLADRYHDPQADQDELTAAAAARRPLLKEGSL